MLMIPEPGRIPRGESDWIQTWTGGQFWPLDPRPEEVFIEDVAHALSMICRFTGHSKQFYSVAEHSVRVCDVVTEWAKGKRLSSEATQALALWGLLHDASEAYLHDLPRPLKRAPGFGQLYKAYEKILMEVVIWRFRLLPEEPPIVKHADAVLLSTERRDLMNREPKPWKDNVDPLPDRILPWSSWTAKDRFMERFMQLAPNDPEVQR